MTNITIVCRDAGPAGHLAAIAKSLTENPDIALNVILQDPATDVFERQGLPFKKLAAPYAAKDDVAAYEALKAEVASCLRAAGPDIVLAGNSSSGDSLGVDEAVLDTASVPVLLMQDWPGDISRHADPARHQYLCVSPDAAARTGKAGFAAHVIGSPAYDAYGDKNYMDLREKFQADLPPEAAGRKIIGFSGQYLTEHPEYLEIVGTLARALEAQEDAYLLYRPHPREWIREMGDIEKTSAALAKHLGPEGGRWSIDRNKSQDLMLAGSDAVIGYFSSSMHDLAMMNARSPLPLATPVAMMWDRAANEKLGVPVYPWLTDGTGFVVTDTARLRDTIAKAATDRTRQEVWLAAQKTAGGQCGPSALRIIDGVLHPDGGKKAPATPELRQRF